MDWIYAHVTDANRRLDGSPERQVRDLADIWSVRCEMVVRAASGNVLDHLECAFGIRIQQAINRQMPIGHIVQTVKAEVAQPGPHVPIIQADVVLFPGLGQGIAHPGQIFAQMCVARYGEQGEGIEHVSRERFKCGVERGEAFPEKRVQVIAGFPVTNVQDPGEVVQSGGRDLDARQDLLDNLFAQGDAA